MKRLDRLQPPSLALLTLFLGPDNRLPVRREDETGAGVGNFDAVTAGLIDVETAGLIDVEEEKSVCWTTRLCGLTLNPQDHVEQDDK